MEEERIGSYITSLIFQSLSRENNNIVYVYIRVSFSLVLLENISKPSSERWQMTEKYGPSPSIFKVEDL